MNWYYSSDAREVGPLSDTALREIHANGGIADETPVRREDSGEWEPYSRAFSPQSETQQDPVSPAVRPIYKFSCTHCQQHISTDEDYSGKTVQCPTCGGEFVVPQASDKLGTIKPGSEISYESQEPEIPTSQEPAFTSPPQTPGTSNSYGERIKGSSITSNKGRGKSKFQVIAVAAAILIAVAVGGLLITKTKSYDKVVTEDVTQIDQSDSANEPDEPKKDTPNDDDASGPSLDLAKYARESEARDAGKEFDYYDCKATYEFLKRSTMVANGLKKKEMLNDDAEKTTVIILSIVNTDWSKCSPRLRERADKVKTTWTLVQKNLATISDLEESVKSLSEITDKVSKSAPKNAMFVRNLPNITAALERDVYGDAALETRNKEEHEPSSELGEFNTKKSYKSPDELERDIEMIREKIGDSIKFNIVQKLDRENFPALGARGELYEINVPSEYGTVPPSKAILITRETTYTSTGESSMWVLPRKAVEVKMQSGFSEKVYVVEESPKSLVKEWYRLVDLKSKFSETEDRREASNTSDGNENLASTNKAEPPLAPLAVLTNGTIEEAKECVRLLDEELGKNPGNERASIVKTAIMDVFKAEASLIAAVSGTKDAEEQYRIKMQNLQVASRPSPLTGRVNTTEVERIRREAEAIKTGSESRIRNAKSALKRTIEESRRSAPAPDREALARVWDQIERRNNL